MSKEDLDVKQLGQLFVVDVDGQSFCRTQLIFAQKVRKSPVPTMSGVMSDARTFLCVMQKRMEKKFNSQYQKSSFVGVYV